MKDVFLDECLITTQIGVEFGNVASSYRGYLKFHLSFGNSLCDIAAPIVPSQHLSTRSDGGVSNFEKTVREPPSAKLSFAVPILAIGLFDLGEDGKLLEARDVKAIVRDLSVMKNAYVCIARIVAFRGCG